MTDIHTAAWRAGEGGILAISSSQKSDHYTEESRTNVTIDGVNYVDVTLTVYVDVIITASQDSKPKLSTDKTFEYSFTFSKRFKE